MAVIETSPPAANQMRMSQVLDLDGIAGRPLTQRVLESTALRESGARSNVGDLSSVTSSDRVAEGDCRIRATSMKYDGHGLASRHSRIGSCST
jgi:hypothetical protein